MRNGSIPMVTGGAPLKMKRKGEGRYVHLVAMMVLAILAILLIIGASMDWLDQIVDFFIGETIGDEGLAPNGDED